MHPHRLQSSLGKPLLASSAAFLFSLLVTRATDAALVTWSGNVNSNFETVGNWSALPNNSLTADTGVFADPVPLNQPNLSTSRSIAGLLFTSMGGGWNLASGSSSWSLSVGAGGISSAGQSAGTNTISANLSFEASQTLQVGSGGTLVLTGSIGESTLGALTIGTASNSGTVVLSPGAGCKIAISGSYAGTLLSANFGTLQLGGTGTCLCSAINSIRNSAALTGNTSFRIGASGTVQVLSGVWNFSDAAANSSSAFLGQLEVAGGTITFGGARYMGGAGAVVTVDGGTFKVTGTGYSVTNGGYFGLGGPTGSGTAMMLVTSGTVDVAKTPNLLNTIGGGVPVASFTQSGGSVNFGLTASGSNSRADLLIGSGSTGRSAAYTLNGGTLLIAGLLSGTTPSGGGGVSNFNFLGGTFASGTYQAGSLGYSSLVAASPVYDSNLPGTLVNAGGILAPGGDGIPGKMSVIGNYQATAGSLSLDLSGSIQATGFQSGQYDCLSVSGTAVLGGNLSVNFLGGYTPGAGDNFTVVSAAAVTGSFDNVSAGSRIDVNGGWGSFLVSISSTTLTLSAYLPPPPPTITSQPANLVIPVGQNASFPVTASGSCSYQWRKNGQPIVGATNSTFTLANSQMSDSGSYDVLVTNNGGTVTSTQALLTVLSNLNLLPSIPYQSSGNPHASSMFNGAVLSGSVSFIDPNTADNLLLLTMDYLHPASPYYGQQAYADRMKYLIDNYTAQWTNGALAPDDMGMSFQACYSYYLLKLYRPDQISAAQQATWEANIKTHCDAVIDNSDIYLSHYVGAIWLNGDIRKAMGAYFGYLALGDYNSASIAQNVLDNVMPDCVLADGGTHYVGYQNENWNYHTASVEYMAWWTLLTNSTPMRNAVAATNHYCPLTNVPVGKGFGEYTTSPSWKTYYNTNNVAFAALIKAYFTGDGYNYKIGQGTQNLLLGFLYTPGLVAKTAPDNYMLFDRNTRGPRGHYGTWGVVGTSRDVSNPWPELNESYPPIMDGMRDCAGAFILDSTTNSTTYALNAAFQGSAPEVKMTTGTSAEDWDRGTYWKFLTGKDCKNAVSKGRQIYGLSTLYTICGTRFSPTNWSSDQAWVFTKDRVIGYSEIYSNANDNLINLAQRIELVSGRLNVSGVKKTLITTGSDPYGANQWTYGALGMKVHAKTYTGAVNTFQYGIFLDPNDTYSTMIELHDSQSIVGGTTTVPYPAGTTRYAIIESTGTTNNFATNVSALSSLPTGLRGFEFQEDAGRKVRMIQNISGSAVTYTGTMTCPYPQMRILESWDEAALAEPTVSGGVATVSISIPAYGHVLLVNSAITDDHTAGYLNYATVFESGTTTDTTPPVITTPGNLFVQASGSLGAVVNYTVIANDAVDGPVIPVCNPPSGSFFPIGTTVVNCTANDASDNVSTASFTVTVNAPPIPRPVVAYKLDESPSAGYGTAIDSTGNTVGTINTVNSLATASLSPIPAQTQGARSWTGNAYDFSNPNSTAHISVAGPVVSQIGNPAQSQGLGVVFWIKDLYDSSQNGSRLYGFSSNFECSLSASGSIGKLNFKFGNTGQYSISTPTTNGGILDGQWHHVALSVNFSGTSNNAHIWVDGNNNVNSSANISAPFNVTTSVPSPLFYFCADSNGSNQFRGTLDEFAIYPGSLNTTRVLQIMDSGVDLTPPVITTPGNLTATATSGSGAIVSFSVTGSDNVDGVISVSASPASGSLFPVGTTNVVCTGTDSSANLAVANFSVTVLAPTTPQERTASSFTTSGTQTTLTMRTSVAGRTYQLQHCDTLTSGSWQNIGPIQSADGVHDVILKDSNTSGLTRRFYRVLIGP